MPKIVYSLREKCQYKNNNFILVPYTQYLFFPSLVKSNLRQNKKNNHNLFELTAILFQISMLIGNTRIEMHKFWASEIYFPIFFYYSVDIQQDVTETITTNIHHCISFGGNFCFKNHCSHTHFNSVMTC